VDLDIYSIRRFTDIAVACNRFHAIHLIANLNVDVGAYFVGKRFGKHKLSSISSAAGSASPNKTIEGALGGVVCCTLFSLLGAYLMQWPLWPLTGSIYGIMLSFIALVGDLTASMMKRDAKMKDTGSILPGHGGLLDRIDSYMLTAPAAFFYCRDVLPWAMKVAAKIRR
jgi:phosphatidate cytidylyltransferase